MAEPRLHPDLCDHKAAKQVLFLCWDVSVLPSIGSLPPDLSFCSACLGTGCSVCQSQKDLVPKNKGREKGPGENLDSFLYHIPK